MATMESLERRLRIGDELRSVVGTMKGLAAASIHEYERAVEALRESTATIEAGLQILFGTGREPLPTEPAGGPSACVAIGSDQGLCGPLNREVARDADGWLAERAAKPDRRFLVAVGKRLQLELDKLGRSVTGIPSPGSVEAIAPLVGDLVVRFGEWQEEGIVRVALVFPHPLGRTQRTIRVNQVVPPDRSRLAGIAERPWPTRMLPESPHPRRELLAGLLRQDLFVAVYRAVAEAKAAEHGSRLAAMQAAEQNVEERLDRLRSEYHRLRQAKITGELLDIVSAYDALGDRV